MSPTRNTGKTEAMFQPVKRRDLILKDQSRTMTLPTSIKRRKIGETKHRDKLRFLKFLKEY